MLGTKLGISSKQYNIVTDGLTLCYQPAFASCYPGTGTTDIGTAVASSSDDFTDVTPRAVTASTSASDLDADDYVNFHIDETGTVSAVTGIHIMMNYVTGVPGGIV